MYTGIVSRRTKKSGRLLFAVFPRINSCVSIHVLLRNLFPMHAANLTQSRDIYRKNYGRVEASNFKQFEIRLHSRYAVYFLVEKFYLLIVVAVGRRMFSRQTACLVYPPEGNSIIGVPREKLRQQQNFGSFFSWTIHLKETRLRSCFIWFWQRSACFVACLF